MEENETGGKGFDMLVVSAEVNCEGENFSELVELQERPYVDMPREEFN